MFWEMNSFDGTFDSSPMFSHAGSIMDTKFIAKSEEIMRTFFLGWLGFHAASSPASFSNNSHRPWSLIDRRLSTQQLDHKSWLQLLIWSHLDPSEKHASALLQNTHPWEVLNRPPELLPPLRLSVEWCLRTEPEIVTKSETQSPASRFSLCVNSLIMFCMDVPRIRTLKNHWKDSCRSDGCSLCSCCSVGRCSSCYCCYCRDGFDNFWLCRSRHGCKVNRSDKFSTTGSQGYLRRY